MADPPIQTSTAPGIPWRRLGRNVLSNYLGVTVALVATFLVTPYELHVLGLPTFGVFALATGMVGQLGLLTMGLGPTLVKKTSALIAEDKREELELLASDALLLYSTLGLVVLLLTACVFVPLLGLFKVGAELQGTFRTAVLIVGLTAATSFPASLWWALISGAQDFHIQNSVSAIHSAVSAIMYVIVLGAGYGLVGMLVSDLALAQCAWLARWALVRHRLPWLRVRFRRTAASRIRPILRFGGVVFLFRSAYTAIAKADVTIIGLFASAGAIGIYEIGLKINNYSRVAMDSVLSPLMPLVSELHAADDRTALRGIYMNGTRAVLSAYEPVAAVLLLLGPAFVRLWLGPGYEGAIPVLYVLLLGTLVQAHNVVGIQMLVGMGLLRLLAGVSVAYLVVNLSLSVALVVAMGAIGAAIATTATFVVVDSVAASRTRRVLGLTLSRVLVDAYLPPLRSTLIAVAISLAWRWVLPFPVDTWLHFACAVAGFGIVYAAALWSLGLSSLERRQVCARISATLLRPAKGGTA